MFPNSWFPRTFFCANYWDKLGAGGFIPPPVGSGRSQYLPMMGVGSCLLLVILARTLMV